MRLNKVKTEKFFFHGILQGRYENEKTAWLEGYEQFVRGFSTMRKADNYQMRGTLADVPADDIKELDMIEGYPTYYTRFKVKVFDEDDNEVEAWVYQQLEDWERDQQ